MKNMQNEPNLKNTQMNLNLFETTNYVIFRPPAYQKNEPNSNPILVRQLVHRSFSEDGSLSALHSSPPSGLGEGGGENRLRKTNPIQQIMKNMQNEPNLLSAKISVNPFKAKNYENKHPCTHGKNEPKRTQFLSAIGSPVFLCAGLKNLIFSS